MVAMALHQHALGIEVGEAQGTLDVGHATLASPLLYCTEQCLRHFGVVDEVYPAEADLLLLPGLVGTVVDDGRYAPHYLAIAQGEEVVGLAKLEGGILLPVERAQHVVVEVGHGVGVALVELVIEANELFQFA